MHGRVRVFIASSLDGFIAGPDNDLSWLPTPSDEPGDEHGFDGFMAQIGAILMGRNTFDVASGFTGPWPYGDTPVLVATNRPLHSDVKTVQAVTGRIFDMLDSARKQAGVRDVYIDGGALIRQAMDANLVDEICITIVPVVLGHGTPLFSGVANRKPLTWISTKSLKDGLVQSTYRL